MIKKPKKKMKISSAKKRAHNAASKYIRARDNYICCTCNNAGNQMGHFIHKLNSTYFEESNINCQCLRCNHYLSGNLKEYYIFMLNKYGQEEIDRLESLKHQYKKWTVDELLEKEKYFKDKLKELLNA